MSSSCIEEVGIRDNHWYRIASELLGHAGIEINGTLLEIFRLPIPIFLNVSYKKGRGG